MPGLSTSYTLLEFVLAPLDFDDRIAASRTLLPWHTRISIQSTIVPDYLAELSQVCPHCCRFGSKKTTSNGLEDGVKPDALDCLVEEQSRWHFVRHYRVLYDLLSHRNSRSVSSHSILHLRNGSKLWSIERTGLTIRHSSMTGSRATSLKARAVAKSVVFLSYAKRHDFVRR